MAINPIGSRTSSAGLPIGATVQGIVNDPAYLQMNGQIVSREDYPKLYTSLDEVPLPFFEDQAVPTFGSTDAYDITYGNSKYVAIGEGGRYATSPDAVTWTLQAGSISATLVSFANNLFYAGGIGGKLYSSSDGITWTQRLSVSGDKFGRVVYNGSNGYFVSGTKGDVYSSTNGTSWGVDYTSNPTAETGAYVSDVVWNSTDSRLKYIVKESSFPYKVLSLVWSGSDLTLDTSADTNIDLLSSGDYPCNLLKFGSLFVSTGRTASGNHKVITSSNLTTWTQATTALQWSGSVSDVRIAQNGSTRMVLVKDSTLQTSTSPASTWTSQTSSFGSTDIRGITFGSAAWAAVGASNKVASGNSTATTWTQQTSPFVATSLVANNVIANDGVSTWLVGGVTGLAAYSVGGASWLSSTTGLSNNIKDVAYGEGVWVIATTTEVPKYSTNLTSWTNVTGLPSATYDYIRYCNGTFVAYRASTGFYYSPDGITWTQSTTVFTLGNTTADAVACGNNMFVAANGTTIHTSPDGDIWNSITHGTGVSFISVYWNGSNFIACPSAASTTLYHSLDGITWSLVTPTVSVLPTSGAGGVFLAAAHVSEDGINWFSTSYGQTTNVAAIGEVIKACGTGIVKTGTAYNYNTTDEIYIPLAPNQTATLRTYIKAK